MQNSISHVAFRVDITHASKECYAIVTAAFLLDVGMIYILP